MRNLLAGLVLASLCSAQSPLLRAQAGAVLTSNGVSAAAPREAISNHEITLEGERVAYTATVADDMIPAHDGRPGAAVVTIAYTRDGVSDPARRPVMFLF